MFKMIDEKAKFRVGSKVTNDYYPGVMFKIVSKHNELNGCMRYSIKDTALNGVGVKNEVRQKDLNKA
jgi:hypothetical protein